jgi:hypothetical protein
LPVPLIHSIAVPPTVTASLAMTPKHLDLTALESRDVPSGVQIGDAWPDPQNLTLSFAHDGTHIGAVDSKLFQVMNPAGKQSAWEEEILRAFQTWVSVTNLNVGLVSDSGDPFGTPGDIQGDSRFGDIRIGAQPLSSDSLAQTAPVNWSTGTWSGDVLFNALNRFAINPSAGSTADDVYSVALHEAGHVFGLADSSDPTSAMSENYAGVRAGLSPADVAAIQAIYGGPRQPDQYAGATGNGTLATATPLTGSGNLSVTGDLNTPGDLENFAFVTPADGKQFTAQLQTSGLSLLTAKLTVLDAAGNVVGSDSSTDPLNGDLQIKVDHASPNSTYYLRIQGATGDAFSVGRYAVSVQFKDVGQPKKEAFTPDHGTNDTPATADSLVPWQTWGGNSSTRLYADGVIESKTDLDYYHVAAPATVTADTSALVVRAVGMRDNAAAPQVIVFDAAMNPVSVPVATSGSGASMVEVLNVTRGASYYIRVSGDGTDAANGNYRLTASFTAPKGVALPTLEAGALSSDNSGGSGTLVLSSTVLFQFSLDSTLLDAAAAGSQITLDVLDATGKRVFTLTQTSGQSPVAGTLYLPAGRFTIRVSLSTPKGVSTGGVSFRLDGGVLSDPIGPTDPNVGTNPYNGGPTSPPPPPGGTFLYTSFTSAIGMVLPYSF